MSENIFPISEHSNYCPKGRRSRQRVFDLGKHRHTCASGLSRVTNYWVRKIQRGTLWELYRAQEDALHRREYCGTFSADQLRDYFDGVGLELDESHWLGIGLGRCAELLLTPGVWHAEITERIYEIIEQEFGPDFVQEDS